MMYPETLNSKRTPEENAKNSICESIQSSVLGNIANNHSINENNRTSSEDIAEELLTSLDNIAENDSAMESRIPDDTTSVDSDIQSSVHHNLVYRNMFDNQDNNLNNNNNTENSNLISNNDMEDDDTQHISQNNNNNNNISIDTASESGVVSPNNTSYPDNGHVSCMNYEDYQIGVDGSLSITMKLDKDNVYCCICYSAMTDSVFRCRTNGKVVHNVCGSCEWQMRRTKKSNGHIKRPSCPICKVPGEMLRNNHLERQLFDISKPCGHHQRGCNFRYFPWDKKNLKLHAEECIFGKVSCPVCKQNIPEGVLGYISHIKNGHCCHKYQELTVVQNRDRQKIVMLNTGVSSWMIDDISGYIVLFIWNDKGYFDVLPVQIVAEPGNSNNQHNSGDASKQFLQGNNQIYFNWALTAEISEYETKMKSYSLSENINIPNFQHFRTVIKRLGTNSDSYINSKNNKPGRIILLDEKPNTSVTVRFFSLSNSVQLGSTLDCRDFTGKWFEAEVIKITGVNVPSCAPSERKVSNLNRRFYVHYLGYSANYDEWFDIYHDSHRIAHRGTYTVGPNLRVVRRCQHEQFTNIQQISNNRSSQLNNQYVPVARPIHGRD